MMKQKPVVAQEKRAATADVETHSQLLRAEGNRVADAEAQLEAQNPTRTLRVAADKRAAGEHRILVVDIAVAAVVVDKPETCAASPRPSFAKIAHTVAAADDTVDLGLALAAAHQAEMAAGGFVQNAPFDA